VIFLIAKPLKKPIKIIKLEVLTKRLPMIHIKKKEIVNELSKSLAGYKGEQSLQYYLSFLAEDEYTILHDIRLCENNSYFFQMDVLILSLSFILILEVKNISGTIIFDETFQQMIRIKNEEEEVFPDPVLQVNHQKFQLGSLLKNKKFPNIPIETLVVMTNPSTLFKNQKILLNI
jgi:Nuclease-related domain